MVLGRLLATHGRCHVRILHVAALVFEGINVAAMMQLFLRLLKLLVVLVQGR